MLWLATVLLSVLVVFMGQEPRAYAWVDVNVTACDTRVSVEKGGAALVEHRVTLRIAGGPLRSFDIKGVDFDAAPTDDGYVIPHKDAGRGSLSSAQSVLVERLAESRKIGDGETPRPVLRVRFDEGHGLARGIYLLLVRYRTSFAARTIPNGALTRLVWQGPAWEDGFDSARVTFELPAAPTEPRAEDGEAHDAPNAPRASLVLTTLRRGVERDQLELMRPYVAKGEPVTWAIRFDPRSLAVKAPEPNKRRLPVDVTQFGAPHTSRELIALALASVVFAALVILKSREVSRVSSESDATTRPVVPIPGVLRAIVGGICLGAGLFEELLALRPTLGASLVLVAVLLAAHRRPKATTTTKLRGIGRWLPVAEVDAFQDPLPHKAVFLDASTRAGKVLFFGLLGLILGVAATLFEETPHRAILVVLDTVAILAIFGTGRVADLPPDPARSPSRFLRAVARRVRRAFPEDELRIAGRIRIPDGTTQPDEVRLAIAPRTAPLGFGSIEVGVVYAPAMGATIGLPEVLLRVTESSPCATALEHLTRHALCTRGRKRGESVATFIPRLPTERFTSGLVVNLLRAVQASHAKRVAGGSHAERDAA